MRWFSWSEIELFDYCDPGERVVEIVAVKKERIAALEAVAVAAERVAKDPIDAVTRFNLDHALAALRSGR